MDYLSQFLTQFQFTGEENGIPTYRKAHFITDGLDPELVWNNSTDDPGWEVLINSIGHIFNLTLLYGPLIGSQYLRAPSSLNYIENQLKQSAFQWKGKGNFYPNC